MATRLRQATTAKGRSHSAHAPILHSRSQIGAVCGPSQRTKRRSTTRYNADQRRTMSAGQRCSRGRDQEACLVSQKILSISTTPALAGRAGLGDGQPSEVPHVSGGRGVASPRPPQGLPHASPGQSCTAHVAVPSRAAPGLTCGRAMPGRGDATRPPVCKIVGSRVELMIVWTLYGHKTHPDNRK
jgi:hypothetical protein